jgi:hypothetical protein
MFEILELGSHKASHTSPDRLSATQPPASYTLEPQAPAGLPFHPP